MICVLASITVKPESKPEFVDVFKANVPAVLAEDGCIEYAPMIDVMTDIPPQIIDENVVTIVEKWESIAHLKAHFQAPHMLSYKAKVKDMVVSVSLKILEEG